MKYEIGNPGDQCFLEADDDKVAAACILFLGNGQYFCTNLATGEKVPGTFFALSGDVNETWKAYLGISFEEFITLPESRKDMSECFKTFSYAHERTSMTNIGKNAEILSKTILTE
jgi:hypothetical protein